MDPKVIILINALMDLGIRIAILASTFKEIDNLTEEQVKERLDSADKKTDELLEQL